MAIRSSARITFLKRHHLRELGGTLNDLQELERINTGVHVDDINNTEAQLEHFTAEKYQGALMRSRMRIFVEEQPSRRVLSHERQAALAKEVLEIEYDGNTYSDTPGILGGFYDYYVRLFGAGGNQTCKSDFNRFCDAFPRLDDKQRAIIESPLSLDEVKSAGYALQGQKSPGPAGLRSEFFKTLSPCLPTVFLEVFQGCLRCRLFTSHFLCWAYHRQPSMARRRH